MDAPVLQVGAKMRRPDNAQKSVGVAVFPVSTHSTDGNRLREGHFAIVLGHHESTTGHRGNDNQAIASSLSPSRRGGILRLPLGPERMPVSKLETKLD